MGEDRKAGSGRGRRDLRVRVKTAKGRKLSSTLWLERQLNDPYVQRARAEGYRGRAAYKIIEIDDKFGFLKPGARVVDLGAAPGGWSQVAAARVNALGEKRGKPSGGSGDRPPADGGDPGVELHQLDFLDEGADEAVRVLLDGQADVVMSDMAAASSGHPQTDNLRITALCEAAAEFRGGGAGAGRDLCRQGARRRRGRGLGRAAQPAVRKGHPREARPRAARTAPRSSWSRPGSAEREKRRAGASSPKIVLRVRPEPP
jgi:23S rRNA (uridine2552-2'-O)-methyltransferase